MSQSNPTPVVEPPVQSPPPAPHPPEVADDPRRRLHELARRLVRTRDRTLLIEYLKLRRALM